MDRQTAHLRSLSMKDASCAGSERNTEPIAFTPGSGRERMAPRTGSYVDCMCYARLTWLTDRAAEMPCMPSSERFVRSRVPECLTVSVGLAQVGHWSAGIANLSSRARQCYSTWSRAEHDSCPQQHWSTSKCLLRFPQRSTNHAAQRSARSRCAAGEQHSGMQNRR